MTTTGIQCDRCGEVDAGAERGQKFCKFCLDLSRPPSQPGREDVARIIVGPVCDATKADHNIMQNGRYAFCTLCGETITKPQIGQVEALNKADAILALLTNGTEPGAVTDGSYVVRQENSDNLCGMTAWGECWSVIDAPDGPDAVSAQWVGFFINRAAAETIARALSRNSTDE